MHSSTFVARAPRLLLFSALFCVGCGGAKGRIVQSVTIESGATLDASDAADGLANHPPKGIIFKSKAEYEPLALEIDRQRVESWFHSRGYFSAEVLDYSVDETAEGIDIVFRVQAGSLATLEKVDIEGAPSGKKVDTHSLYEIARLELGQPVEYEKFMEGKSRMEARLANESYAHAKVDAKLEVEKKSGRADRKSVV